MRPALLTRAALVVLGIWLNAADGLVTVTLMPSVARDLGGAAYFGWAVAVFLTASIVAGASAGRFAQRLNLRSATLVAAFAYVLGCVLSACATDISLFLAGRALQGVGAGWIVGFCYVAIEAVFPERLWSRLFAAAAGAWGIASLVGPLIGGLFSEGGNWRGAFWMFAAQGVVFAAASAWLLGASSTRPIVTGMAWRTLGVLTLSVSLIAAANLTRGSVETWVFLILGVLVFLAALRINNGEGEGLLPSAAARPWTVAGAGYAMIFIFEVGTVGLNVYQAAILQIAYGVSALIAGYVVSSIAMGWTAAAFFVASAPERRHSVLIVSGAGLIVAGYAVLVLTIAREPLGWVAAAGATMGVGFGLSWSLLTKRIVGALPDAERTVGAAAIPTTQLIGGAVGAAVSGALANMLGLSRHFTRQVVLDRSLILFGVLFPIVLLGFVAALNVVRARRGATDRD